MEASLGPRILVHFDRDLSLALAEVKNGQGRPTQFIGNLATQTDTLEEKGFEFVGMKKTLNSELAVTQLIGDFTAYQRLFVYPYGDIEGEHLEILTNVGNSLKEVSNSFECNRLCKKIIYLIQFSISS